MSGGGGNGVSRDARPIAAPAVSGPVRHTDRVVFEGVSKFYGEVLGINRVQLSIAPGITGLVGPNGSGKTTLMNLMTGLIQPTQGQITILGIPQSDPERLFSKLGYCTQFDSFPKGFTGYRFIYAYLRVYGYPHAEADRMTQQALDRVRLTDAAQRKIAGYSKGMRQRIKLAQAVAHDPQVLILDEPLNGLDPMARAEIIELFKELATSGKHVIISSHILHEVDLISDNVVLLNEGYVVAEGDIRGVRSEVKERPIKIQIRCDRPGLLASQMFQLNSAVEASITPDGESVLVCTKDADRFYAVVNDLVLQQNLQIEEIAPADEDVQSVYEYLIGGEDKI